MSDSKAFVINVDGATGSRAWWTRSNTLKLQTVHEDSSEYEDADNNASQNWGVVKHHPEIYGHKQDFWNCGVCGGLNYTEGPCTQCGNLPPSRPVTSPTSKPRTIPTTQSKVVHHNDASPHHNWRVLFPQQKSRVKLVDQEGDEIQHAFDEEEDPEFDAFQASLIARSEANRNNNVSRSSSSSSSSTSSMYTDSFLSRDANESVPSSTRTSVTSNRGSLTNTNRANASSTSSSSSSSSSSSNRGSSSSRVRSFARNLSPLTISAASTKDVGKKILSPSRTSFTNSTGAGLALELDGFSSDNNSPRANSASNRSSLVSNASSIQTAAATGDQDQLRTSSLSLGNSKRNKLRLPSHRRARSGGLTENTLNSLMAENQDHARQLKGYRTSASAEGGGGDADGSDTNRLSPHLSPMFGHHHSTRHSFGSHRSFGSFSSQPSPRSGRSTPDWTSHRSRGTSWALSQGGDDITEEEFELRGLPLSKYSFHLDSQDPRALFYRHLRTKDDLCLLPDYLARIQDLYRLRELESTPVPRPNKKGKRSGQQSRPISAPHMQHVLTAASQYQAAENNDDKRLLGAAPRPHVWFSHLSGDMDYLNQLIPPSSIVNTSSHSTQKMVDLYIRVKYDMRKKKKRKRNRSGSVVYSPTHEQQGHRGSTNSTNSFTSMDFVKQLTFSPLPKPPDMGDGKLPGHSSSALLPTASTIAAANSKDGAANTSAVSGDGAAGTSPPKHHRRSSAGRRRSLDDNGNWIPLEELLEAEQRANTALERAKTLDMKSSGGKSPDKKGGIDRRGRKASVGEVNSSWLQAKQKLERKKTKQLQKQQQQAEQKHSAVAGTPQTQSKATGKRAKGDKHHDGNYRILHEKIRMERAKGIRVTRGYKHWMRQRMIELRTDLPRAVFQQICHETCDSVLHIVKTYYEHLGPENDWVVKATEHIHKIYAILDEPIPAKHPAAHYQAVSVPLQPSVILDKKLLSTRVRSVNQSVRRIRAQPLDREHQEEQLHQQEYLHNLDDFKDPKGLSVSSSRRRFDDEVKHKLDDQNKSDDERSHAIKNKNEKTQGIDGQYIDVGDGDTSLSEELDEEDQYLLAGLG